jgi:hypothetical protein
MIFIIFYNITFNKFIITLEKMLFQKKFPSFLLLILFHVNSFLQEVFLFLENIAFTYTNELFYLHARNTHNILYAISYYYYYNMCYSIKV